MKNAPTYQDPTGQFIKVHITGCQLFTLAIDLKTSFAGQLFPLPAGSVANWDGSYDILSLSIPPVNLGWVSLWVTALADGRMCPSPAGME